MENRIALPLSPDLPPLAGLPPPHHHRSPSQVIMPSNSPSVPWISVVPWCFGSLVIHDALHGFLFGSGWSSGFQYWFIFSRRHLTAPLITGTSSFPISWWLVPPSCHVSAFYLPSHGRTNVSSSSILFGWSHFGFSCAFFEQQSLPFLSFFQRSWVSDLQAARSDHIPIRYLFSSLEQWNSPLGKRETQMGAGTRKRMH